MQIKNVNKDVRKACEDAIQYLQMQQKKWNAIVTFCDIEEQLKDLQKVDKQAPFYGVPIVLKDNFSTKGMKTTASSRILDNYIPIYDACAVEKLKQAGAIIIAKASMDELGMGGTNKNAYTGAVNNPYDINRISGGSSGGSASVVAGGAVALALGTDTGDSVRKPAAYTGVVGVKPTYGRISRYGVIPYASSLDHVGYFTTSIQDAALTLEVLAGRDDRDMTSSFETVESYSTLLNSDIKGKRIAVLKNITDDINDKDVLEPFETLLEALRKRGAIIEHVSMKQALLETILPVYFIIANSEAVSNHSNLDGVRLGMREDGDSVKDIMINTRTKGFSAYVRKRFMIGGYSLYQENQDAIFRKAQKVRRLLVEAYAHLFDDHDIVLSIAASSIAPLSDGISGEMNKIKQTVVDNHMILGNFSGYPSLTQPYAFKDGLPLGVNITAKAFDEQTMFDIAKAIEEETTLEGNCLEVKA